MRKIAPRCIEANTTWRKHTLSGAPLEHDEHADCACNASKDEMQPTTTKDVCFYLLKRHPFACWRDGALVLHHHHVADFADAAGIYWRPLEALVARRIIVLCP
jgi:hypothetical protein|tara:strand:- start:438 stop:746 length:309 start_codon:yes stop_codon:yes gene_type:complete